MYNACKLVFQCYHYFFNIIHYLPSPCEGVFDPNSQENGFQELLGEES